jgi:Family of unknown function (DUF6295)
MCTYHTERVELAGSGKGPGGWFPLRLASVYFDHPRHTAAEHTLNIDFLNPAQGPSARVAVELDEDSARALAGAIVAALVAPAQAAASRPHPAADQPASADQGGSL